MLKDVDAHREALEKTISQLKLGDEKAAELRTRSKDILGTPLYMSSGQVEGDGSIDHRADLYALGQLAYTMCVGHAYFDVEARAGSLLRVLLRRGVREPASVRARRHGVTMPPAFDGWFDKATARRRGARFASAEAQIAALALATEGSRPVVPGPRRRLSLLGATGATLGLVAASFAAGARRTGSAEPPFGQPASVGSVAALATFVAASRSPEAPLEDRVVAPPLASVSATVSAIAAAASAHPRSLPVRAPPVRTLPSAPRVATASPPPAHPSDHRR